MQNKITVNLDFQIQEKYNNPAWISGIFDSSVTFLADFFFFFSFPGELSRCQPSFLSNPRQLLGMGEYDPVLCTS